MDFRGSNTFSWLKNILEKFGIFSLNSLSIFFSASTFAYKNKQRDTRFYISRDLIKYSIVIFFFLILLAIQKERKINSCSLNYFQWTLDVSKSYLNRKYNKMVPLFFVGGREGQINLNKLVLNLYFWNEVFFYLC